MDGIEYISKPAFSKKLGRKVEIDYKPKEKGDPRRENVGAMPASWW